MAWNGSDGAGHPANGKANRPAGRGEQPARPQKAQGVKHGLLAGLIIVALGCAALWFFTRPAPPAPAQSTQRKAPSTIVAVKPAVAPKVEKRSVEPVAKTIDTNDPHRVVEVLGVTTNASFGWVYTRVRRADGKIGKIVTPAHKPIFKHGTDQLLQMMLCQGPNVSLPPMPMRHGKDASDKAFLASLKDEIVINDDDSEKVRWQKEIVKQARAEIKELMDQGAHFNDILDDYTRLTSENREIRRMAQRELNEIHASGDTEGEREYQIKIDAALSQMGIDPLDKPMTAEERRAARAERIAQRELEKQNQGK